MAYSPVPAVQQSIANTVRSGLSELGNRPLEQARFDLQKAQILDQIGRQNQEDLMKKTLFDQQQEEYKRQQAELNRPLYVPDLLQQFFGKPGGDAEYGPGGLMGSANAPSRETVLHVAANGWLPEGFKMAGITLGKPDETGKQPLIRYDGSKLTERDSDKVGLVMQAVALSKIDAGHLWNEKARRINNKPKSEWTQDEQSFMKFHNKKDPEALIAAYNDQINKLEELRGPLAMINVKNFSTIDNGIARKKEKIKALQESVNQKYENQFKLDLENLKRKPKEGDTMGPYKEDGNEIFRTYEDGKWVKHSTDIAEWIKKTGKGKDSGRKEYLDDPAKLVDDTNSHYSYLSRVLLDDQGYVKQGPEDDPQKYEREYRMLSAELKEDKKRVGEGKVPMWLTRDKVKLDLKNPIHREIAEMIMDDAKNDPVEAARIAEKAGFDF